jgi:hypothetical protein
MLKKLSFLLLFSLFIPIFAQAATIDFPYYQGWVTTDGGTTVNDGYWIQMNNFGHQNPASGWDGYYHDDSNGTAHAIRLLNNGAFAKIYWWYDGDPAVNDWVLDEAELFRVDENTITYYGLYDFEEGVALLFDNPIRLPRKWKEGQSCTIDATIGAGAINIHEAITFLRQGLTVPAIALPGSSDLTNCALMQIHVTTTYEKEEGLETWAPGKGEVWEFWYEYEDENGTELNTVVNDKVIAWESGGGYPSFMSDDFTTALSTLNGLTLSDSNVKSFKLTGGNRVVVIPLFN